MIRSVLSLVGLVVVRRGRDVHRDRHVRLELRVDVSRQTAALTARANDAGDGADRAIGFVRGVIAQAGKDLDKAREQTTPAEPTRPVSLMDQIIARKASQELAGSVERAHGAVVTASDAVTVADAALQVFSGNEELKQLFGVQSEQLNATKSTLGKVTIELRDVKTVLGMPVGTAGPLTKEQLNAVDGALGQARGFTDELEKVVMNASRPVNEAKSRWTSGHGASPSRRRRSASSRDRAGVHGPLLLANPAGPAGVTFSPKLQPGRAMKL